LRRDREWMCWVKAEPGGRGPEAPPPAALQLRPCTLQRERDGSACRFWSRHVGRMVVVDEEEGVRARSGGPLL
jgi:hypothetical protein